MECYKRNRRDLSISRLERDSATNNNNNIRLVGELTGDSTLLKSGAQMSMHPRY